MPRKAIVRNKLPLTGMMPGAVLILFVALVPLFSPFDPDIQEPSRKLLAPDSVNFLGTDQFGRDVLTRVAVGGRRSLGAAFLVVGTTLSISFFFGIFIGLAGGIIDTVFSRVIDVFLAIPSLILALAIVGVLGVGFENLLLALVISFLAFYTRLVRGLALSARDRPDVITARLSGIGWLRIICTHIAPDAFRQMLVVATLDLGGIIISIAGMSFLGLGAQPPDAEWGAMLGEARFYYSSAPHLIYAPAAGILLSVISANLIGNKLKDERNFG